MRMSYATGSRLDKPSIIDSNAKTVRKGIDTEMISKEQASSRKNGTKFDIIKTVASLKKEQNVGSMTHYDSMLQQRQSGKVVVRRRDEGYDSPFDDEGDADMDHMSISNFSKKYMSESTELTKQ